MRLELDIGNSWIKWRTTNAGEVVYRGRTKSWDSHLEFSLPGEPMIDSVLAASVADQAVNQQVAEKIRNHFGIEPSWAKVELKRAGVTCAYKEPHKLGVDRWLAILAAYNEVKGDVIVVDAGSAITLDVVKTGGVHLGGYILPGLQLMREALWRGTTQVKVEEIPLQAPRSPGTSTGDAVNRGCAFAVLAAIELLCGEQGGELLMTGGDAEYLGQFLSVPYLVVPDLVLDGLALALEPEGRQ